MHKSRVIPTDFGLGGNNKAYGTSGETYFTNPWLKEVLANPETTFYSDSMKANSIIPIALVNGLEIMESSEFRPPRYNACNHTIQKQVMYPFLVLARDYRFKSRCNFRTFGREGMPAGYSIPSLLTVNRGLLDAASRNAWWEMQPRFEGEVQGLNFLFELKDFKEITNFIVKFPFGKLTRAIRDLRRKVAQLELQNKLHPGKGLLFSLNDAINALAKARLAYSFAIKPLISDLISISESLKDKVDAVQQQFREDGQSENDSHYSEVIQSSLTGGAGSNNYYWRHYGTSKKVIFTATMSHYYQYSMRSKWAALRRYWGLETTPEVIWNAIPFTFLTDYVCTIGKAIHRMRLDNNVHTVPIQYCESVLCTATAGVHALPSKVERLVIDPGNGKLDHAMPILTGYSVSSYKRVVTAPNKGTSLPSLRMPNTGQLWNTASLAKLFW